MLLAEIQQNRSFGVEVLVFERRAHGDLTMKLAILLLFTLSLWKDRDKFDTLGNVCATARRF